MQSVIKSIVSTCIHRAWVVVGLLVLLGILAGSYSARNFAINTDINELIAPDLPWRQREIALDKQFPQRHEGIIAVIDAPTSELAAQATAALAERLAQRPELFREVQDLGGSPFFAKNALLFETPPEVARTTQQLLQGEALIQLVAADPSLRGLSQALGFVLAGVQAGQMPLDATASTLDKFSATLEDVLAGRETVFSWRRLLSGGETAPRELRRFLEIRPVLDFAALEPGKAATDAVRQAASELNLASQYHARLRLTGPVPIADEEFATVQENALLNWTITVLLVLAILWLGLRSTRIIFAVFVTLAVGLFITFAVGLMMVSALNLISIAFAVLFVGLGVDFGIQYSVRYRTDRHDIDDLDTALVQAGGNVGVPLTLAATATAAGFLSFLPTDYRGVSELGQIAGVGMIIAFLCSVTLLPALIKLLNPKGEPEGLGYAALAPLEAFLQRNRTAVLVFVGVLSIGGLPLLANLQFDFNPMNLRSPKVESIATYLDLRSDAATGVNAIDVLAPSLDEARAVAARLEKLPETSRVMTLASFVPEAQEQKLPLIEKAAKTIQPHFEAEVEAAPTDAETVETLQAAAADLTKAAGNQSGPGAVAARRLADVLTKLSASSEARRAQAAAVLVPPLRVTLDGLRLALQAEPVTAADLPEALRSRWMTPDGRARVEVHPAGDPADNETLRRFAEAVLAVAPTATGGPVSILESGRTIVSAFIQAGGWALLVITILLWLALRQARDVMMTLIPLALAAVVTLEICVLVGLKLNFANIIALPLLLGIGVAFMIYYVMAWRAGQTNLLQSSLTRAVLFSALTTATAFGSLWLSSHPGTSSMGKLLALSLVTTLAAAVLFQPVLMGRPRRVGDN